LKGWDLVKLSKDEMRKTRRDLQIIFQDPVGSLDPRSKVGVSSPRASASVVE